MNDSSLDHTSWYLKNYPDLRAQISRIETWFNQSLEKSVSEIISAK